MRRGIRPFKVELPAFFPYDDIMRLFSSLLLLFSFMGLMASCSLPGTGGSLHHETFVRCYADLIEAGQAAKREGWDRNRLRRTADSLFAKEGCTRAVFFRTVILTNGDPMEWRKVSDDVTHLVEERERGGTPGG